MSIFPSRDWDISFPWRWNRFRIHLCCAKTPFVKSEAPCWVPNYIPRLHFIWEPAYPSSVLLRLLRGWMLSGSESEAPISTQLSLSQSQTGAGGKQPETHHIRLEAHSRAVQSCQHREKEVLIKHSLVSDTQWGDWEKLPDYNWPTCFCQRKRFGNFDSESLNLSLNLDLTSRENPGSEKFFSWGNWGEGEQKGASS